MTGEVLEEDDEIELSYKEVRQTGKRKPPREGSNGMFHRSGKSPAGVKNQSGDAGSSGLSASAANPVSKVGIVPTNVGGRSHDTNR